MSKVIITLLNKEPIEIDGDYFKAHKKIRGAAKRHGFRLNEVTGIEEVFETVEECQENDLKNIKENGSSDNRRYA